MYVCILKHTVESDTWLEPGATGEEAGEVGVAWKAEHEFSRFNERRWGRLAD